MKKCPNCGRVCSDSAIMCTSCRMMFDGSQTSMRPTTNSKNRLGVKGYIESGSALLGASGTQYKLLDEIKAGGEGAVYNIQGSSCVAKIYHKDIPGLKEKIEYMVNNPLKNKPAQDGYGAVILTWPLDTLMDRNGEFVGYVMSKVAGDKIFEFMRGFTNDNLRKTFPHYTWLDNLKIAINLASAVDYIHSNGFVIGDMNDNNLLVGKDNSIIILDTDSFDFTDAVTGTHYACRADKEDIRAPENFYRGKYNNKFLYTKETDYYALAMNIFRLLMNNKNPLGGIKLGGTVDPVTGKYVVSKDETCDIVIDGLSPYFRDDSGYMVQNDSPDINLVLPQLLIDDFRRTFCYDQNTVLTNAKNRTNANIWKLHLKQFYEGRIPNINLVQCRSNRMHWYIEQNGKCEFCNAEMKNPHYAAVASIRNQVNNQPRIQIRSQVRSRTRGWARNQTKSQDENEWHKDNGYTTEEENQNQHTVENSNENTGSSKLLIILQWLFVAYFLYLVVFHFLREGLLVWLMIWGGWKELALIGVAIAGLELAIKKKI